MYLLKRYIMCNGGSDGGFLIHCRDEIIVCMQEESEEKIGSEGCSACL